MRIIRYQQTPLFNPAASFPGLREEMDRLFETAFPSPTPRRLPIDLFSHQHSFIVRAEVPGFRKEDLNVEVEDGTLTLTAHRKTDTTGPNGDKTTTQEQAITRSISLPEQVKVEEIAAKYEHGVLTITLPKQEEAKPRQVTIDVK